MNTLTQTFGKKSLLFPYPISSSLNKYSVTVFRDPLEEWEFLSVRILHPVLMYLSHMLLSDLVSTGCQPSHLYHRIQDVLSRPMMGHYAGFLRETARYYRAEGMNSRVPELIGFLVASDVDCTILGEGRALLGELVEYRNLVADGRIDNARMVGDCLSKGKRLAETTGGERGFFCKRLDCVRTSWGVNWVF